MAKCNDFTHWATEAYPLILSEPRVILSEPRAAAQREAKPASRAYGGVCGTGSAPSGVPIVLRLMVEFQALIT